MLYFDRIDVSERTDVNKTNESKESEVHQMNHAIFFTISIF